MAGGISTSGPTPWWQNPTTALNNMDYQGGVVGRLQSSAPSGYQYDPVKMQYIRTPASAGQNVNTFLSNALPGITGSAMGGLTGALGTGTAGLTGGAGAPSGSMPSGTNPYGQGAGSVGAGGAYVPPIQAPDITPATQAAYASAKDTAGKTSKSAIQGLNDAMAAQGMLGSGAQVQGTKDIISDVSGQLGQVTRDQAQKQADLSAQFAGMGYQGALTQRGQDIAAQEAQARLALESRQQYMSLLQTALGGLTGLAGAGIGSASGSGAGSFLY